MMNKNAIILLSGGLDSVVSLAMASKKYNIVKALFFNYGQRPFEKELSSCEKICKHFDIELEIIELDWYSKISQGSALNKNNTDTTDKSYWMPNRNGLFLNIAGAYADVLECKYIIIGANAEEANTFSDNSKEFINEITKVFETSTKNQIEVLAPLVEINKNDIVKKAIEFEAPLNLIWSCYYNK